MGSTPKKIKLQSRELEVVDIPTMHGLSDEEYRDFIQSGELMYVDHHEVLRSYPADYPIATTREQLDIYIAELQRLRDTMVSRSENGATEIDDVGAIDDTDKPMA